MIRDNICIELNFHYITNEITHILQMIIKLSGESYSWGPMFVDCQKFAGSLGRYFMDHWFVELHCKTNNHIVNTLWEHKLTQH